jgi:hypothetical protein
MLDLVTGIGARSCSNAISSGESGLTGFHAELRV